MPRPRPPKVANRSLFGQKYSPAQIKEFQDYFGDWQDKRNGVHYGGGIETVPTIESYFYNKR